MIPALPAPAGFSPLPMGDTSVGILVSLTVAQLRVPFQSPSHGGHLRRAKGAVAWDTAALFAYSFSPLPMGDTSVGLIRT